MKCSQNSGNVKVNTAVFNIQYYWYFGLSPAFYYSKLNTTL